MIQTAPATSRLEMHEFVLAHGDAPWPVRPVRWGAIVGGAFTAIAAQVVFALLGAAIGLTIVGASGEANSQGLGIGAGIWWLITGLISLFAGGVAAGCLAGVRDRVIGLSQGFLAWCTVTVFTVCLVAFSGTTLVSGSLGAMSNLGISPYAMQDFRQAADESASRGDSRRENVAASSGRDVNDQRLIQTQGGFRTEPAIVEIDEGSAERVAAASWMTVVALMLGATVASLGGMWSATWSSHRAREVAR